MLLFGIWMRCRESSCNNVISTCEKGVKRNINMYLNLFASISRLFCSLKNDILARLFLLSFNGAEFIIKHHNVVTHNWVTWVLVIVGISPRSNLDDAKAKLPDVSDPISKILVGVIESCYIDPRW